MWLIVKMAARTKSGSTRRFGPRYGRRVRNKLDVVESISKKLHKCPYCNSIKVKRLSVGIYACRKCRSKFTGRAYAPLKKKTVFVGGKKTESVTDDIEEEMLEDRKPEEKMLEPRAREEQASEEQADKENEEKKEGREGHGVEEEAAEKENKKNNVQPEPEDKKTQEQNTTDEKDKEPADKEDEKEDPDKV
jgi:ribosomal protein eL43